LRRRPFDGRIYALDRNVRVTVDLELAELVNDTIRDWPLDIELNGITGWPVRVTHDHYMRNALSFLYLRDQSLGRLWRAYEANVKCHQLAPYVRLLSAEG
jgi:hypothetical protein